MPTLYAQPYNLHAQGFYFESEDEYNEKADSCIDVYGVPVEEFEIQFIDGDPINCDLFKAWDVHQGNFAAFLEAAETLDTHKKIALIALGQSGYTITEETNTDDVMIYYCDSLQDLAWQFLEEGLYGPIPDSIRHYLDIEAMARDLGFEYTQDIIGGEHVIYRCP